MLTILATKAVLVGLRTLVVVPLLDIQAAMAIREITLQGTLVVLETILLVPLVTTQNHPQATGGCKKRADVTAHDSCNSRLLVLSQHCLLALVQPPTSLRQQTTDLLPHMAFSYLGYIHRCYDTLPLQFHHI